MFRIQLSLLFFFAFCTVYSQQKESSNTTGQEARSFFKGQVISRQTTKPLEGAYIFNLNTVIGTTSNQKGAFSVNTKVGDTIYISYLGYQSIKLKMTNDFLKEKELVVELNQKSEEINEVVVRSNKLIGVLEIDLKNAPKDKYSRIHINGIQQTYEVGNLKKERLYLSPIDAFMQPIDLVYRMFGSKPAQLKKMKKLKEDDEVRKIMEAKMNREIMMEYLDMDAEELNGLLNSCNYSNYFIKRASDLQLVEAILLCYENYKAIENSSIQK
jgi:hypothetical protein